MFIVLPNSLKLRFPLLLFLLLLLSGCNSQTSSASNAQKTPVPPETITEFSVPNVQKTPVPPGTITEFSVPVSNNHTTFGGAIVGPDGNIWFTQRDVIWRLSLNGRLTRFSFMKSSNQVSYYSSESGGSLFVGPDSKLWFDESNGQIANISLNGMITEFPLPSKVSNMGVGAVAGPDGNIWSIDPTNNFIEKFSPRDPSATLITFPFPLNLGKLDPLIGLIVGPDHNLWFTLAGPQNQLGRITPNGMITLFSSPGTLSGGIGPIFVGPDHNLWFMLGNSQDRLGRITLNGTITTFAFPEIPSNGNISLLIIGPDDNFWFTNPIDDKIVRFSPTNPEKTATEFSLPASDNGSAGHPSASPGSITVGPDGNLWFTEFLGHKIGRIDTNGTITEFPLPMILEEPYRIFTGPDDNLWFTEANTYKIGRITSGK